MPVWCPSFFAGNSSNLFRDIKVKNVTFVLDTSESMNYKLEAVKHYLIQTLYTWAYTVNDCKFNIIAFSGKVAKYCDSLIDCSSRAVEKTIPWIKSLECKTGRNMQHALAVALDDPASDAVYLITDGIPDINPQEIYTMLTFAAKGRPVHTIYVMGSCSQPEVQEFLGKLSWQTGASFQAASLNRSGSIEQLIPIYQLNYSDLMRPYNSELKYCSMVAALNRDPYSPPGQLHVATPFSSRPYNWSTFHPRGIKIFTKGDLIDSNAGELIRGVRVLARRKDTGYYYLGRLGQEVEGYPGRFLVQFDKDKKTKQKAQSRLQETALHDLIHYEDGRRLAIGPGCKVLAPWEVGMDRYGPGTVLQGGEQRGLNSDHDGGEELIVNFWNGRTEQVPPGIAVWISVLLAERIILELQMTTTAKQKLLETYPDYPHIVPPGYRGLRSNIDVFEPVYQLRVVCEGRGLHTNCGQVLCWIPDNPTSYLSPDVMCTARSVASTNELKGEKIPGTKLCRLDRSQKVMEQLTQRDLPFQSNTLMKEKRLKPVEFDGREIKTSLERITDKKTLTCQSGNLVDMNRSKSTTIDRAVNKDCGLFNHHQSTKDRVKEKDTWKYRERIPSAPLQRKSGTLQPTSHTINYFPSVSFSGSVKQGVICDMDGQSLKPDYIEVPSPSPQPPNFPSLPTRLGPATSLATYAPATEVTRAIPSA
ncbi:uncharacterized protein [Scyliorhinus torazame]|uniref:uncharacterized protein isoform X1 n=2 Tax=Scyliorhinus torazame TaxID=75743 RepID=UPI003B5C6F9B